MNQFGVPTIPSFTKTTEILFPAVIKPTDSSGCKGFSICHHASELEKCKQYALRFSRSGEIVIEKYLKNRPEIFFHYTIVDGEFSLSCGFENHKIFQGNALAGLPIFKFPTSYLSRFIEDVHPKIVTALKSIGIRNGVFVVQTFFDEDRFYVFEAGFRLGGGQMYWLINAINGVNQLEMMVNFALTGVMSEKHDVLQKDSPFLSEPCCQYNILVKSGTISTITGLDQIRALTGVVNVTEVRKVGDVIEANGTTSQLVVRIHLVARSMNTLSGVIEQINKLLHIKDEFEHDMILHRYKLSDFGIKDTDFKQRGGPVAL
jgi:biotin carboxylase